MLWRKDFGADQALSSIRVDPTDWRHVCVCGAKGSIIVMRMLNLARDKVEQQTYKVDVSASKPGDTLRCCFSSTRDLLYVLLPREVRPSPLSCKLTMHCHADAHTARFIGCQRARRHVALLLLQYKQSAMCAAAQGVSGLHLPPTVLNAQPGPT